MSGLTRRFVEHLLSLSARQEPALQARLQLCLMDHLGCVLAGGAMPWAGRMVAALGRWPVPGGSPVIGKMLTLAPAEAAFANAVLASSASRTDTHPPSNSHPGAVIFPVLLALAAQRQVSGAAFIDAALAGYQAMGRLGRIMVDQDFRKRFRTTSVIGTVAGAVAAAHLLRLDASRAVHAVALAANAAGGLMEWGHSGGQDLMYQGAGAARAAVTAGLLAEAGCTASETILEGEGGLLAAFGGLERREELLTCAEPRWEIEAIEFKPVPACIFVQASAYAALKIITEYGVNPALIEAVEAHSFATALRFPGCDNAGPITEIQAARMSLQHSVAAVLARGELTDQNYAELDNPLLRRLTAQITLHEDTVMTAAFPARQAAAIVVKLSGGQTLSASVDDIPVFGPDQVLARFRAVASQHLDTAAANALEAQCSALAASADMRGVLALFIPERRAA